jgi:hypothetical protein
VFLALIFGLGLAAGSGHLNFIGAGGARAFRAVAEAHYKLFEARQHLTAEGRAEYAVMLAGNDPTAALDRFLATRPGWEARAAAVSGWTVVSAPDDSRAGLDALREQPFSAVVFRNRGLWLCH